MKFEGANGTFRGIASVLIGWDELIVDLLLNEKVFEDLRALVVQFLEFGSQSRLAEERMQVLVGRENGFGMSVFEWRSKDEVAVEVIEDEKIPIAGTGCGMQFASQIGVEPPGGIYHGSIAIVGSRATGNGYREWFVPRLSKCSKGFCTRRC